MNLVELVAGNMYDSPCIHGNIVDGHACYCHADTDETPRKCHLWRRHGDDPEGWCKGDWDKGCPYFEKALK